jgi:hypothetical protein
MLPQGQAPPELVGTSVALRFFPKTGLTCNQKVA